MHDIKGVIFDLDGTLVDTLSSIGNAVNEVLSQMGLRTFELESFRPLIGGGPEAMFEVLLEHLPSEGRPTISRCMQEMERFDCNYWITAAEVFDGVDAMLDVVAEMHMPAAVVTNKRHHVAVPMVSAKFGVDRFTGVFGAGSGMPMKPDPAVAEVALRAMMVSAPEHVAFLGDTEIDMETARRACCIPIGVEWGFRSRAQLTEAGALTVLRHPLELIDVIGGGRSQTGETQRVTGQRGVERVG